MVLLSVLFSISSIQTKLGSYLTEKINEDAGIDLTVEKVDFSLLGTVRFRGVKIKDHHKDTLIFVNKLSTSVLNAKSILNNDFSLGPIYLEDAYYHMKTYKGEDKDNMAVFIDAFSTSENKDSSRVFKLSSKNVYVDNLDFKIINANVKDSVLYSVHEAGGNLQKMVIDGANFSSKIRGLYFKDKFQLNVINLTTDFSYSKINMTFLNTKLQTENSNLNANIVFNYNIEDLSDFVNKVQINADFAKSDLAVSDLKLFYEELYSNDKFRFKGNFSGKLNDFKLNNFKLSNTNTLILDGDLIFKNAIKADDSFVFKGKLNQFSSTYKELSALLPNLLGRTLPANFLELGLFKTDGNLTITPKTIEADLNLSSEIGDAKTDLNFTNYTNSALATYNGVFELNKFNIGQFINDSLFGVVSLKADIDGTGLTLANSTSQFIGDISEFEFKNYVYNDIITSGSYTNNRFDGTLSIDDKNFKMDLKGLADLSKSINKFDFSSTISHLNLKETNLFTRDSIAVLKGVISVDMEGTTLDNIIGKANFSDVYYTNDKQEFRFKKFAVSSELKENVKTIEVTSKDIIDGAISGNFTFSELFNVVQNALGSIYTNFEPYNVSPNQYVDFKFIIYNQIVSAFFPDIIVDNNTKIKGKVQSNKDQLRLVFSSPNITLYGNQLKDVLLRTDNQNPLYNTHLTASEVNTPYYKVSKLNLLNKTQNDTLFFKSEFNGGGLGKENFNLDFYYTINKSKKSVVGFQKSTFEFKNTVWNINPDLLNTDKIVFNVVNNEYDFSQFKLVSDAQEIAFNGSIKGATEKSFMVALTKVQLQSFLPEIDSLALKGKVTGNIDFIQKNNIYKPEATLVIDNFEVNDFKQGNLALNVVGDNSYDKFKVDLSIKNESVKSISATGNLDFSNNRPLIDLQVFLEDYDLKAFSPLGADVISSLRGIVSGDFYLRGFLRNPDMEGALSLYDAGLKFPYLNIDLGFDGVSTITLSEQSFIFEDIKLLDSKYKTEGRLLGNITHQNFEKWFLDLEIDTNNLVVLDTENSEDALYFGTAFINGSASITGLTDQLDITVNAITQPNTKFVVPLKDIETVDNYQLIHFKTDKMDTEERQKKLAEEAIKGLSLNINLDVTKDAEAQVVIDEENGSQLTGRGAGNLEILINTRGRFDMYGDYTIDNGVYDFKYGGIINKPFVIQKGGTVSWNGNPYEADLDFTAIYKAKANPAVLLQSFNSNRKEEIDLVTRITGGLFNSKQELDIQLTNVDPTIASELEFVLNDNNINEKTTQFISLLALGTFRNPDKVSFDVNNTLTGTASSALATAFSSILNSPDSKFQLGLDYQQGDVGNNIERLNIDNQVDVSVSTQLFDNLIINGKVGVPVGGQSQSSVVGEVKIEVLLNEEGNFRGIIFNRQNEIQYSQQEEGYTQGVGLSYQVNFNTLSDFLTKIGLKKKKLKRKQFVSKKDTIMPKKNTLINFEGN
ncbi:translocation/assembly module TamB domain-containing protein [Polaribacter sp.]|uniref:translocation/assembly module TamB domain-containing protein n=1 Tax=Polaribacter sp. TaxID=1920175 RepID=UPI0025DA1590|nr:translocation/assembly module TamB domain-containing protein [Polaribacter sp.]